MFRLCGNLENVDIAGLLSFAENQRAAALHTLDPLKQTEFGQYFTPIAAAQLIAAMPRLPDGGELSILDPGAGTGILSAALCARILAERPNLKVNLVALERDSKLLPYLNATLRVCEGLGEGSIQATALNSDFILDSLGLDRTYYFDNGFDLIIQNPPYGKINVNSDLRCALRAAGMDAPNLYAAFVGISTTLLRDNGQIVAITPRSFFNGPYFSSFRKRLLDAVALDKIHVFESRSTVFADTDVLQENVIFSGTRGGERQYVELSVSQDHNSKRQTRQLQYPEVVNPTDSNRFIRIAVDDNDINCIELMKSLPCTLHDLGLEVSTGRVVDFRSRSALRESEDIGGYPLIYPGNLRAGRVEWPRNFRKPQWFVPIEPKDAKLLLPSGWYTIVKRFSAKEERRRIVAATWAPIQHHNAVAFENHLNIFHFKGSGIDRELACGLTQWLNSSLVDRFFRTFSGHTQVNATDLRTLRFPTSEALRGIGRGASTGQIDITDEVIENIAA